MPDPGIPSPSAEAASDAVEASSVRFAARRMAADRRFKAYGQAALSLCLLALVALLCGIGVKAASAFTRHVIVFELDPGQVEAAHALQDRAERLAYLNGALEQELAAVSAPVPSLAEPRSEARSPAQAGKLVNRLALLPEAEALDTLESGPPSPREIRAALIDDLDLFLKSGSHRRQISFGEAGRLQPVGEAGAYRLTDRGRDGFASLERAMDRYQSAGTGTVLIRWNDHVFELRQKSGAALDMTFLAGEQPQPGEQGGAALTAIFLPGLQGERTFSNKALAQALLLKERGMLVRQFNTSLFTQPDSSYPDLAGAAAGIVGSILTMLITALFAVPVGVMAAIYLEEFAKPGWGNRLIEVNINNLAAVPSIIFGLLGAAVFLNVFGLPRSVPLVGGLVLGLLVLPMVIIASRAALQAVSSSTRDAALGLGASHMRAVFDHVLPQAMPGILTGSIIAMARAIGETAPLLLIGMVAFVSEVPRGPEDEATVLPVLIFKWFSGAERAWEPMTAALIVILLACLAVMNILAVILRRRFERSQSVAP
ncbi:MAG: phosphate ABC transporter permease PstA [Pseudomonadota bacterium]